MNRLKIALALCWYAAVALSGLAQTGTSGQWAQFRGNQGLGILENSNPPVEWDVQTGQNILWKVAIPGLAHSSPVIWEDAIFITTAVSSSKLDSLKIGLYGDIDMADDRSVHQFKVYRIDRKTGKVVWERIADEGIPKERRHTKSTYANPTPATDGKHLVVSFGSHGLYCYSLSGTLLWKKDLGNLATGPFNETGVEWGFSSSPVIHEGQIVVQCDLLKDSFLATYDLATGNEIWRIKRDAISSWGSPCLYDEGESTLIIANGYPFMMAYDFKTGAERWRIGNVGDAPAPTAVVVDGLAYINSAHGRHSPILAIRPGATGDLTLPADSTSSRHVVWSIKRGGAYMASPLVYQGLLYNMQINGQLTCYDARTGKHILRVRPAVTR